MTKMTFVSPDQQKHHVETNNLDQSLMELAVDANIPGIDADCGGGCACATCHVILSGPLMKKLGPLDEDEEYLLDFLDNRQKNSRLSCQISLSDSLNGEVFIVPET